MEEANIKFIDDNINMLELFNLIGGGWAENKYEIKHPNPFEMIIEMYYKDWAKSGIIKYNISTNKFRCNNKARSTRQIKTTEAIRKQLYKIYIDEFN